MYRPWTEIKEDMTAKADLEPRKQSAKRFVRFKIHRDMTRVWLTSAAIFAVLAAPTVLVWKQQVDHQRSLLARHNDDVANQASRRLQVFIESHLQVASIFARRWSTHEAADFSKQRFDAFGAVLIRELPGYHAIGLIHGDTGPIWMVPGDGELVGRELAERRGHILQAVRDLGRTALLTPYKSASGHTAFLAVLPMMREQTSLGFLVVYFHAETLIDDCFHTQIQSEFHFIVKDSDKTLFRSDAQASTALLENAAQRSTVQFPVGNRTWQLEMVPKRAEMEASGWTHTLSIPLLGFALSVGLSVLVFLLSRRMDLFRSARDKAFIEIEERQKAEQALKISYERHALLSRKAIAAQEEERARLSVDLHDELGQILTAIRLELGLAQKQLAGVSGGNQHILTSLVGLTENATEELRGICKGLRPPLLDDLGLEPAVRFLVDEFKERSKVETDFTLAMHELEIDVPNEVALCTYRILQESLTNIRRHSQATHVKITLEYTSTGLELSVIDNGVGFEMAELGAMRGWGLEGMQERASLVNGTVAIRSAYQRGTRIFFRVPVATPTEAEVL